MTMVVVMVGAVVEDRRAAEGGASSYGPSKHAMDPSRPAAPRTACSIYGISRKAAFATRPTFPLQHYLMGCLLPTLGLCCMRKMLLPSCCVSRVSCVPTLSSCAMA